MKTYSTSEIMKLMGRGALATSFDSELKDRVFYMNDGRIMYSFLNHPREKLAADESIIYLEEEYPDQKWIVVKLKMEVDLNFN